MKTKRTYGCYQRLDGITVAVLQAPAGKFKAYYIFDSATQRGTGRGPNMRMLPVSSQRFASAEECAQWLLKTFATKEQCAPACPRKPGAAFSPERERAVAMADSFYHIPWSHGSVAVLNWTAEKDEAV